MANRLLRYECALFQNSFADAFARKRDRLLLLLVVIFASFWLRDRLGSLALPPASPRAFWLAALSLLPAFAWHRQLMARLAWLIEHSAVAPAAMERLSQRVYILVAHAFVSVPLLIGATVLYSAAGWALALLAYAAGVGVAAYIPLRITRRDAQAPQRGSAAVGGAPMLHALLRRQTLGSARPGRAALLIVAASFAFTAAAIWLSSGMSDAVRLAAPVLPPFLALLIASRLDAGLIGFLPYAGRRALSVGVAVSALPAANFAAAAAAVFAMRQLEMIPLLLILLLLHFVFIIAGLGRAWLYPGRHGRSVDLQVQIEFVGLALIFLMLPPLALAALVWRLGWLHRRYSRLIWIHP